MKMKRLFKGTGGAETLRACFEATEMALMMLRASIKNNNPKFSEGQAFADKDAEMNECWRKTEATMQIYILKAN